MFSLTRREQLLVASVLLAFCAGLGIKRIRDAVAVAPERAALTENIH